MALLIVYVLLNDFAFHLLIALQKPSYSVSSSDSFNKSAPFYQQ
jgi:hypothetical protein